MGVGEGDVGDGGGVGARGRRVGARGGRWWCVEGEARTQEAGRQRRRGGASAAVRAEGRAVGRAVAVAAARPVAWAAARQVAGQEAARRAAAAPLPTSKEPLARKTRSPEGGAVQGGEDEGVTERVVLPGSWRAGHGRT